MSYPYQIKTLEAYHEAYKNSIDHPEKFWGDIAENFTWRKKWDKVLDWNFTEPKVEWFKGGKLNITENCIDRHLAKNADKPAIIWEPNDPKENHRIITYKQLHLNVSQFAQVLINNGVQKGDRVCIYMGMIPELAIAVLACARIGAIHSVIFVSMLKGRDLWWEDEIKKVEAQGITSVDAVEMDAEDPLFILYTSGSTGKPKGVVHSTAGYMVYTNYTFVNVFQYEPNDLFFCTADIGWITGHSYIVYAPLSAGGTSLMFEGIPTFPDAGRFWDIIDKFKVNILYTAPTAIRSLMSFGLGPVEGHDLSSLKVLGTVGEPINEEAWHWYDENIGKKKCPIVDTWWQTETGGIMISNMAGITPGKPGWATYPMPGVQTILVDDKGLEVTTIEEGLYRGNLCITQPWPATIRTTYGDHERCRTNYFATYPNLYFTGDGALKNELGQIRITGRVDDVLNVSGHRIGTAEVENAINMRHLYWIA